MPQPNDIAALIRAHQAEIYRYLRYLGADAATAEDLVQETFLAVLRSGRVPAETETGGAAWLRAVALDGKIGLWDAQTFLNIREIAAHKFIVESVEFSHDGKMLVSGSFDGTVKLWNVKTGGLIRTLQVP